MSELLSREAMHHYGGMVALGALALAVCLSRAPAGDAGSSRVPVAAAREADRIAKLIEQLGHEEWEKREQAVRSLVEIGLAAVPFLEEATSDRDPERSLRARDALGQIEERHKELTSTWRPSRCPARPA